MFVHLKPKTLSKMLNDILSVLFALCFWNLYVLCDYEVFCQFEIKPLYCARVWSWSHLKYCGKYIYVDQNQVVEGLNFFVGSAQVRPNCNLSITNTHGLEDVVYTNCPWKTWNDVSRLCCECNGCLEAVTPLEENSCAVLYQNERCSACSGFRLEVNDTEEINSLDMLTNDKISSFIVKPGCELFIYADKNFKGNNATVIEPFEFLNEAWNNKISSLKCYCGRNNYAPTTLTTYQPTTSEKLSDGTSENSISSSTVPVADTTVYIKEPSTEVKEISTTSLITEVADISTTEKATTKVDAELPITTLTTTDAISTTEEPPTIPPTSTTAISTTEEPPTIPPTSTTAISTTEEPPTIPPTSTTAISTTEEPPTRIPATTTYPTTTDPFPLY